MQPRTLLILSGLVLVLGAFILFYEKELPSTDERVKLEKKVLEIEQGEVTEVEISWGERRVGLERKDVKDSKDAAKKEEGEEKEEKKAEWWLVEPFSARADSAAVNGLLGQLAELQKQRTLEDVARAEVGLDSPRARVRVATAKGESLLLVGGEVPNAQAMIVGVEGRSEAYQVAEGLFAQLTKEPGEWRDKQLFSASRDDVERISLEGASGGVVLARRGEGFWLESPVADRADREAVDTLLNQLTSLRAERFVDGPDAGFASPTGTIEVGIKGREQPWRLELGALDAGAGSSFARVVGQLVTIGQDLPKNLEKGTEAWRSRGWTSFQVYQIDAAEIKDSTGTLSLARAGADWKRGEDRIAFTAASDFLYAVAETKAEELRTREQALAEGFSLAEPRLTLTVTNKEAEREELALYEAVDTAVGERVAATTSGRDAVLLLGMASVTELESKLAALRSVEKLPPADEAPAAAPADEDTPKN